MVARRNRVFFRVGPLIFVSWLTIAFLEPDPGRGVVETIALGFFFGSMFAHTTFAAAWSTFGPAPLSWRLPLSLVWVTMLGVAIAINLSIHGGPDEAAVVLGFCLLGQWLLLQFPLWGLKWGFSLELRHKEDVARPFDPREWQFGIRQLIIITAIVGVAFGIGRLLVAGLLEQVSLFRGEAPVLIFLVAAAIVLTLPLVVAGLLERWAPIGILIALVLVGVGTAIEVPLLMGVSRGPGPKIHDLIAINVFTSAILLTFVLGVRFCGYSLARVARQAA